MCVCVGFCPRRKSTFLGQGKVLPAPISFGMGAIRIVCSLRAIRCSATVEWFTAILIGNCVVVGWEIGKTTTTTTIKNCHSDGQMLNQFPVM